MKATQFTVSQVSQKQTQEQQRVNKYVQQLHVQNIGLNLRQHQKQQLGKCLAATEKVAWKVPPINEVVFHAPTNNISENIYKRLGKNLHNQRHNPLQIIKQVIYDYLDSYEENLKFDHFDDLGPIVTTSMCFDEMLVPEGHVSRLPENTYYLNQDTCLRAHTSAHETELMRQNYENFLVTGDVYRRDTIDATHSPVFHQMEGVRLFSKDIEDLSKQEKSEKCLSELKKVLEGLSKHLFGDVQLRWVDAYFPFTDPSIELEVFFNGKWLEVLGCGVLQQSINDNAGMVGIPGWAFGLGLERLAMVLFDIPDIRLFWCQDERFLSQFRNKDWRKIKFQPFSNQPPNYKDITFWIPENFDENSFYEVVRNTAGDLVEEVVLIDKFVHPKKQRTSNCFRITYRSMERSLTDEEINKLQERVRQLSSELLKVELR